MKFKLKTINVKKAMNLFKHITTNFDFNNISDNVFFEIKDGNLFLRATNELIHAKVIFNLLSENKLLDTKFLVPATELINVIRFADSKYIKFNLQAEDSKEGIGKLIIKGKSKASLPLKSLFQFPKFPNINENFQTVENEENFKQKLNLLSQFTDKEATNYLSGINYNPNTLIANKKISSLMFKNELNLEDDFILSTDILKTFKMINNINISKDKFFNIKGKIEQIDAIISYKLINDEYPVKRINKAKKQWLNAEYKPINITINNLSIITSKLKHLINQNKDNITMNVSNNKITFKYEHNNFKFERHIEETNSINLNIKLAYKRLEELLSISKAFNKKEINIRLLENNIMLIKDAEYLYMCGVLEVN